MRRRPFTAVLLLALTLIGCAGVRSAVPNADLATAEAFIDAFYSFDAARLRNAMRSAAASIPAIGFYQGWAEGGHYEIVNRSACQRVTSTEVACAITVKDDLIAALGLPEHVTDTFHLSFSGGRIVHVKTSSNDPPVFNEALQWVVKERPEVADGPCRGFFANGPTPQECVRAVVQGFRDFTALKR